MPIYKLKLIKFQEVHIEALSKDAVHDAIKDGNLFVTWDPLDAFVETKPSIGSEVHEAKYGYEISDQIESDKIHLKIVDRHVYFTDSAIEPDPPVEN